MEEEGDIRRIRRRRSRERRRRKRRIYQGKWGQKRRIRMLYSDEGTF